MNYAIYITAAAVLALLIALVALTISWLQKRVLRGIRSKTLELLSTYDELLEEKSKALAELNRQSAVPAVEEGPKASQEPAAGMSNGAMSSIERASTTAYRQEEAAHLYRVIRQNFSYDLETVIPVLNREASNAKGPATQLLEKLSYDIVYQLSTLTWEEQKEILMGALNPEEQSLLEEYIAQTRNPGVLQFYDHLTSVAATEPGPVRLMVAPDVAQHWSSDVIEILPDNEICEGYQIEQNNILYDFSIKTRELN